jgi:hypothetical protein
MASDPLSPVATGPSGPPRRLVTQMAGARAGKRPPSPHSERKPARARRARASYHWLDRSAETARLVSCNAARKRDLEETRVKTARLRAIDLHPLVFVASAELSSEDLAERGAEV